MRRRGNTDGAPDGGEEDDIAPADHPARGCIDAKVRKHFNSSGWVVGTVKQVYLDEKGEPLYHVEYSGDGDEEDLNQEELDVGMGEHADQNDTPPCLREVSVRQ